MPLKAFLSEMPLKAFLSFISSPPRGCHFPDEGRFPRHSHTQLQDNLVSPAIETYVAFVRFMDGCGSGLVHVCEHKMTCSPFLLSFCTGLHGMKHHTLCVHGPPVHTCVIWPSQKCVPLLSLGTQPGSFSVPLVLCDWERLDVI